MRSGIPLQDGRESKSHCILERSEDEKFNAFRQDDTQLRSTHVLANIIEPTYKRFISVCP